MNTDMMREKLAGGNTGVVMVGISGSGKSTVAREICPENGAIVSTDEMREKITGDPTNQKCSRFAFELAHKMWEARLRFRQTTIFDATSTTNKARKSLMDLTNEWNKTILILVAEELDISKARNAGRERMVPEWVLDKQMDQLQGNLDMIFELGIDEVWHYTSETGFTAMTSP